jgi:hypothetical protein
MTMVTRDGARTMMMRPARRARCWHGTERSSPVVHRCIDCVVHVWIN